MTMEEKIDEMETRLQLAQSLDADSVRRLLATLRKCREQRNSWIDTAFEEGGSGMSICPAMREEDLELLKIFEGKTE